MSEPTFEDLMARLRQGDNEAAAQVFRRFARRLISLAWRRLDKRMRQRTDAEDVLQSVFGSFFSRLAGGHVDLASWDSLWAYLVVMTLRKCGRKIQYHHSQRRDISSEVSLISATPDDASAWELPSDMPTPAEVAMLDETLDRLRGNLAERDRPILFLRLQGHTVPEIAAQAGRSERTVHRVLQEVRKHLEQLEAG